MRRRCFVLTLLACGLFPSQTFAQKLRYTSFDAPGSNATSAISINNLGTISGRFDDAFGAGHGFLWSGGVFMRFGSRPQISRPFGTHKNCALRRQLSIIANLIRR